MNSRLNSWRRSRWPAGRARDRAWPRVLLATLGRIGLFAGSLILFTFSLLLIREGIAPLADELNRFVHLRSPAPALGFGWLAAMVVLSGSPVAAAALSFLDAGVLDPVSTFAMVAGSRLGASFIVLVVGFAHLLRGRQRTLSLGAGLLSMLVTQSMYLLVIPMGLWMMRAGWLRVAQMTGSEVTSPFELLLRPPLDALGSVIPVWALFPLGFLLLLPTFRLFDLALPQLPLMQSRAAGLNRLLYRPWVSFLLGALLTSLTLSVSVSLSLLVPLSVRGYVRQENVVPYAMGANITTFVDTLLAAALLANPAAVTVVLVQMTSVALVALLILVLGVRGYERVLVRLSAAIGRTPLSLSLYLLAVFALPVGLLLGG